MRILQIQYRTQLHVANAYSPKFKMAAAANLDYEKLLPFLYYLTNSHQNLVGCCKFDVECNCWIGREQKDQIRRWRLPPYWDSKRCGYFNNIKPYLTKHVDMEYWPAARKTANITVKNYNSFKRGVNRPDNCTYKNCKNDLLKIFTLSWSG